MVNRKVGGAVITSHRYTLDAVGHRTQIEEQGSIVKYVYDKLYRLTEEHRTGNVTYDAAYTYDPVGNRLSKTATDGSSIYAYDENDRLLSDGKYTYQWDNAGRMVGKTGLEGLTTYAYNPEDRLIEVSGPDGWARFTYDASGNRIGRTTAAGTTSWLIDPNMPYAQVLEETVGGATKVFAYGNDLLNVDGPDGARWFAYDGLGSTRALTDGAGTLTDAYAYEAFGSLTQRTGTTGNEFLFTGEQWEPGLGMYYLRARYYNPVSGRFIARDPWYGRKTKPLTITPYIYCNDSPIMHIDLSGKEALPEIVFTIEREATLTLVNCQASAGAVLTYTIALPRIIATTAIMLSMTIGPAVGEMISAMIKAETEEDSNEDDSGGQILIYRWGSNTNTNLTPREIDINGLSFSTIKPIGKKFVATTIELINETGVLIAIKDGPTHVSIRPLLPISMKAWIASRPLAEMNPHPYTVLLKKLVVSGGELY